MHCRPVRAKTIIISVDPNCSTLTSMIASHMPVDEEHPKNATQEMELPAGLRQSDKTVWRYLSRLSQGGDVCTASIPKIAQACSLSQRQVQISVGRLIEAGLIRRVGYDFGNPNRARRGSIYKMLS
jgi:predicted transcriptional regulator